jgi:Flp pilus assembly protein TadG
LKDERGSLSILSTSLFFLLVISSFVFINASSAMLAKRELVQISETAMTRATHALDVRNYYLGNTGTALPIDCAAAYQIFTQELSTSNLRKQPIGFNNWNCDGRAVYATVSAQASHLLRIPFTSQDSQFMVSATISAINRLQQ